MKKSNYIFAKKFYSLELLIARYLVPSFLPPTANFRRPFQSCPPETIRNIAVLELLFASGIRVSELCTITCDNLNLDSQVVLIRGKGSKERKIYLASAPVVRALKEYLQVRVPRIADEPFFFLNRDGNRLSEQSVRRIINRYTDLSNQPGHYTPHMFRHSFATYLWDACGDVYEVKEILGHSSIKTTERYVHASFERQKKVLSSMHPRATLEFTY